jgi:hypothetical protein
MVACVSLQSYVTSDQIWNTAAVWTCWARDQRSWWIAEMGLSVATSFFHGCQSTGMLILLCIFQLFIFKYQFHWEIHDCGITFSSFIRSYHDSEKSKIEKFSIFLAIVLDSGQQKVLIFCSNRCSYTSSYQIKPKFGTYAQDINLKVMRISLVWRKFVKQQRFKHLHFSLAHPTSWNSL